MAEEEKKKRTLWERMFGRREYPEQALDQRDELRLMIGEAVDSAVASSMEVVTEGLSEFQMLEKRLKETRKKLADLEIDRDRKLEEFAAKEREIQHMVGLHQQRVEHEIEVAKKEATLTVQEENLQASKDRFEEQMKFHETRFTEEIGYLKDLLLQTLDRVPNASAIWGGGKAQVSLTPGEKDDG